MTAWLEAPVRLSFALSCGCRRGKTEPIPGVDADTLPGRVVICDYCQEYAVVTRVSVYLDDTSAASLEALLREGGIDDPLTAAQVAAEQGAPS